MCLYDGPPEGGLFFFYPHIMADPVSPAAWPATPSLAEIRTMDWTPMIGRYRPLEQDALRVLTIVHRLGEQPATPPAEPEWRIDSESQLQHLDHLVRHPIDLAYVLIDQVRSRGAELAIPRADLARRLRRLLGAPRSGRHRPHLLRPFDAGSWQRWDDVLAFAGCRGLLRVEPISAGKRPSAGDSRQEEGLGAGIHLRYRLTAEGARWLGQAVYPGGERLTSLRERCELLRTVLPDDLLRPRSQAALAASLRATGERLEDYRRDEQIRPEDDLLGRLFRSTFREAL